MAVCVPVLVEIAPVLIEEAIALARAAALIAGDCVGIHAAFQPVPEVHPDPLDPGPEKPLPVPRQVTQGEQNLATKIAEQLNQDSLDVGSMQMMADETLIGTVTTEEKVLLTNKERYSTITTKMTALEAATIAGPGVNSIESSNAYILHWSKIAPSQSRVENLANAQRLLASLAQVDGTV